LQLLLAVYITERERVYGDARIEYLRTVEAHLVFEKS